MFKNMKIAQKIISGFLVSILFIGFVGFIGISNIRDLNQSNMNLYDKNTVPLGQLGEMTTNIATLRATTNKLVNLQEDEQQKSISEIQSVREELQDDGERLKPSFISEEEKALFLEYEMAIQDYFNKINEGISYIESGNNEVALEIFNKDAAASAVQLQNYVNGMLELKVSEAKMASDINASKAQRILIFMGMAIGLAVVMALGVGFYISRIISRPIMDLRNAADKLALGNTDIHVDYDSKDEMGQAAKSFGVVVSNLKKLVTEAHMLTDATIEGHLNKRGNADRFEGDFKKLIQGINTVMDIFIKHFDSIPMPIMMLSKDLNVNFMNAAGISLTDKSKDEINGLRCSDLFKSGDCGTDRCACAKSMKENKDVSAETDAHPNGANLEISYTGIPMRDMQGNIVGAMEVVQDLSIIKQAQRESEKQAQALQTRMETAKKQEAYQQKEVEKLIASLAELAKGHLDIEIEVAEADEDTKEIAESFNKINNSLKTSTDEIKSYIQELTEILAEMAEKNFTKGIEREYLGDFVKIKSSINYILEQFNSILLEINTASEQVEFGAEQVASTSQSLSQGASEQASSVEQISATIAEIADKIKGNATNANKANELSIMAREDAQKGNEKMRIMLTSMDEIKMSSKNIGSVIKVIEDIAFQTNILALNAAVEAARAGEHGKGFAVVAEEVRNLAARSATAAKETTELIDSSINKVDEGYEITNDTAEALKKIVVGVTDTEEIIGMIAQVSNEQAAAITEVDTGVQQISEVTQTNTATSEESASASEEMAGQAQILKALIQQFQLKGNNTKGISGTKKEPNNIKEKREDISILLDDDSFGKY